MQMMHAKQRADALKYNIQGVNHDRAVLIHENPNIYEIPNFLTEVECKQLCKTECIGYSKVGPGKKSSADRTSMQCNASYAVYLRPKICKLLNNLDEKNLEPLGIIRYKNGQEYRYHHDFHQEADKNRITTILIYLNDNDYGTHFKHLNLTVKPKTGKCLIFFPCFRNGEKNYKLLHAGLPVKSGEKYILQSWAKQK